MTRRELAEQVNAHLHDTTRRVRSLDGTYIGKLERGEHRWPNEVYRTGLRAVLDVATDAELGFHPIRGLSETLPCKTSKSSDPRLRALEEDAVPPLSSALSYADVVAVLESLSALLRDVRRATADASGSGRAWP